MSEEARATDKTEMQNQSNPNQPCSSSPSQPPSHHRRDDAQQQQQLLRVPQSAAAEAGCHQQQQSLGAPPNQQCWKSTPGAGSVNCHHPPRLSLSAILPLSAAGSHNNRRGNVEAPSRKSGGGGSSRRHHHSSSHQHHHHHHGHHQHHRRRHGSSSSSSCSSGRGSAESSDRTMLPVSAGRGGAAAAAAASATSPESSLLRRFFSNPRVRRSLAIDIGFLLIFVPLSIGSSLALLRLFVHRVGQEHLEWHHYMLVAALACLVLVPVGRLVYSAYHYRKRIRRMRAAEPAYQLSHPPKDRLSDFTTKSRRIEADGAARAQDYHQFAFLVAKQQNIDLTRRGDYSGLPSGRYGLPPAAGPLPAGDRSAANLSGISCHRPDISMAAYNC